MTENYGRFENIPNSTYHESDGFWSSSQLKYIRANTLFDFKQNYLDGAMPEKHKSESMLLGSAVHCLTLTPDDFEKEFLVHADWDLRTKAGKENKAIFEAQAKGRMLLSAELYEKARRMSDSAMASPFIRELLADTQRELSMYWRCAFSGLNLKARADAMSDDRLIELKSALDISPSGLAKQVHNLNYDLSLAHYLNGIRSTSDKPIFTKPKIYFIAVRNDPPFLAQHYEVSDELLDIGHGKWLDVITRLSRAYSENKWPGYFDPEHEPNPKLFPVKWAGVE